MSQGASPGVQLPDKKFLLELPGQALRAVRRKTRPRDPRPRPAPSLDLFHPARAAWVVRARAPFAQPAVPNRVCLDSEIVSGSAGQKRRASRLHLLISDLRRLRG